MGLAVVLAATLVATEVTNASPSGVAASMTLISVLPKPTAAQSF